MMQKERKTKKYIISTVIIIIMIMLWTSQMAIVSIATEGEKTQNQTKATATNQVKAATWYIDTNLDAPVDITKGLHIQGWKLATAPNTKIHVYLNDLEIDPQYIQYSRKYDLISIVKGYGTYTENPTPHFDVQISGTILQGGRQKLKITFTTEDGNTILGTQEKNIQVTKNVKHVWNIDTNLDTTVFDKNGIIIEGWKLAQESGTKLVALINGKEVTNTTIETAYRYDLISIVKGYGTYTENPEPNFTITIPTTELQNGKYNLEIQFLTNDNIPLETLKKTITVDKTPKHIWNIDTNLNGATFDKTGIIVEGWKLSTEPNTKIVAYIDGKVVENTEIQTSRRYDLISIVKGYGTYTENPEPNFTIKIPTTTLSYGTHTLKIQFLTQNDDILETLEKRIMVDKSVKHLWNIDTDLENQVWGQNGLTIEGWKLSTEPNTKLEVYIDNIKNEKAQITYSRKYDLISIVKGYGTYTENPTPNFSVYIPKTEFSKGSHVVKLQMVTETGTVLEKIEKTILESKTRIHIETPYTQSTITNETHPIIGWAMTTAENTSVKLLIDGEYQKQEVKRVERPDVLKAITGYGDKTTNQLPGYEVNVDFSKLNIGLHQIVIRVEEPNGEIVGEQVIYIFLRRTITYEQGTYGVSGLAKAGNSLGSELQYYRYGDGPNVFFATFTLHGFEDNWAHDGAELVTIANKFYETLKTQHTENYELADTWTIYILPEVNPDGRRYGTTNNGPGRTTLYSQAPNNKGIDLNRCWKSSGFNANVLDRNYIGTAPYQAYEAQALRDFLQSHKSQNGQTILVDLHGWLQQLIGDRQVGMYYAVQFPENNGYSLDKYGDGYLINWARTALASNGRLAKTALIELPDGAYNHQTVENRRFAERYIQATLSMLHGIL